MEEIKRLYPSQWVILVDHKSTIEGEVLAGRVAFHCDNRDVAYRALANIGVHDAAVLFTGPVRSGARFML